MKYTNTITTVFVLLFLTGCAKYGVFGGGDFKTPQKGSVYALNYAQATGSPFTRYLAAEYRAFSNVLYQRSFSRDKAEYFGRKGLAAVDGIVVLPESLGVWRLSDRDIIQMSQARSDLIQVLDYGGRQTVPDKAAIAQSRFDCWVVEQSKRWNSDIFCRRQFMIAMEDLVRAVSAPPPARPMPVAPPRQDQRIQKKSEFPEPLTTSSKGEIAPVRQAMFIVFFDWDKYRLSSSAHDVLDAVAEELKMRDDVERIVIVGHADTSGQTKYNKELSLKRANAIKRALISRSISPKKLHIQARGEQDLLVDTPDNTREPGNRRAQITLE